MEIIVIAVAGIIVAIGAYIFGRNFNGSGNVGVKRGLDDAGKTIGRAKSRIGVSRNSVDRSRTGNRKARSIVKTCRAILARAKERAHKKDDSLGDG